MRPLSPSLDALSSWTPGEDHAPGRDFFVKENIEVADLPFSAGSATRLGVRGRVDAACVSIAKAKGYHVIGTTRCDEFAYGCTGETNAGGPCKNPHDRTRITGGSSSGSAAAVAAGLSRFALGTDTGGSARIPAALCGVFGFKPRFGSIGTDGVVPLSPSLDHVGLIADSLDSLLGLWSAYAELPDPSPSRPRLAFAVDAEAYETDSTVGEAWQGVSRILSPDESTPVPGWREARTEGRSIQAFEALREHGHALSSAVGSLHPDVRSRLQAASEITEHRYHRALDSMRVCREGAVDRLSGIDAIVLPTVPICAPVLGTTSTIVGGRTQSVRELLLRNTRAANFSGLPALTVPLPAVDLPIGLQIVGPSNDAVLNAGRYIVSILAYQS